MKNKLTPEEQDVYNMIKQSGSMDDVFDIAFAMGAERVAKEIMHDQKKLLDGFGHPKDCEQCAVNLLTE